MVVKLFSGAVIQLIPKPLIDLFNLRYDHSVRSALLYRLLVCSMRHILNRSSYYAVLECVVVRKVKFQNCGRYSGTYKQTLLLVLKYINSNHKS